MHITHMNEKSFFALRIELRSIHSVVKFSAITGSQYALPSSRLMVLKIRSKYYNYNSAPPFSFIVHVLQEHPLFSSCELYWNKLIPPSLSISPSHVSFCVYLIPICLCFCVPADLRSFVLRVWEPPLKNHAACRGGTRWVHPARGWVGLDGRGWGLHLHRLLLLLPQVHHRLLQGDRGHLQRHQLPSVLDLLHYVGRHVRWRLVSISIAFLFCSSVKTFYL